MTELLNNISPATSEPLIRASDLHFRKNDKVILEGVSLHISPGEVVTLIGPNGAGKTTLVRILLGIAPPDSGSILRRKNLRVGYVPQRMKFDRIFPITVERYLRLGASTTVSAHERLLEETGVRLLFKSLLHELSGGEMQRVVLARSLLRGPELLVLDEPVEGVDAPGQAELYELIYRLKKDLGLGILLVSHDLHLVFSQTDRVVCLDRRICCSGHPDSVLKDPVYSNLFGPSSARKYALYTHSHGETGHPPGSH
ncbi:MAG: metal ABC transporter ATP-binding protein [Deltaproteobacteria bacterium]|nr:metal ABC transporter ATP-binding protein [Deltaproteobacteria bacterium]